MVAVITAIVAGGVVAVRDGGHGAFAADGGADTVGSWSPILDWPGVAVHTTLLSTGEVLTFDAWEKPSQTRIWDPATGRFRTISTPSGLFCSGHTTLADGRVLVAGGHDLGSGYAGIADVNVFDPRTGQWTRLDDMHERRWYPSVTRLGDGRVVALSGNTTWTEWADRPEIFDPATGRWTTVGVETGDLHEEEYPLTFLLPDGRLFTLISSTSRSSILDIENETWTDSGLGTTPVANGSATMYRPGKVLISGGGEIHTGAPASKTTATVDLTAANPSWQRVGSMNYARYMHTLVVLPEGSVLAVGGSDTAEQETGPESGALPAELWDPATGQWTELASMATPRMYHSTATLLPDGRVLVAGGGRYNTTADFPDAEIFSPPYLFRGARPVIAGAPANAEYAESMLVATPQASDISSVALVSLGSVTHSLNMDQHYVPLAFSLDGDGLRVAAPSNPNDAPPGYYMLFVIDNRGVPSSAAIVHLGDDTGPAPQRPETVPGEPDPAPASPRFAYTVTVPDLASSGTYALSAYGPPGATFQVASASRTGLFPANEPDTTAAYLCRRPIAPPPDEALRPEPMLRE